jgi:hypothetical protein
MKMKKYLMTGIAALALCVGFTSCSHDIESYSQEEMNQKNAEMIVKNYEKAFVATFGQPAANQNWGFGDTPSFGRTRTENANANEWADPNKAYGGLLVPPAITDDQAAVVREYFQTHRNLGYKDPQWTNYFIQQVYKGFTAPKTGTDPNTGKSYSPEKYLAADGNTWIYASDNMDHLAAINGTFVDHINNFNHGDCSENSSVLDNGGDANNGPFHTDKIMYMKESTTASFGYYNSNGSVRRTEYTGLVGWKTIHDWALVNYPGYDGCLNDNWNRSYMGFDFEQMVGPEIYAKIGWGDNANDWAYYTYDGVQYHYLNSNMNMYCGNLIEYNDLNGVDIAGLLADGYLPVQNSADKKWVKVGGCADGYYSDWIVTLTEAKTDGGGEDPTTYTLRVMAEDLSANEASDFDFNDVVFDVEWEKDATTATITLHAAGGTLPLRFNEDNNLEVHKLFGVQTNVMVNTGWSGSNGANGLPAQTFTVNFIPADSDGNGEISQGEFNAAVNNQIKIEVEKVVDATTSAKQWFTLTAQQGVACCKFGCSPDFEWVSERTPFNNVYTFSEWVSLFTTTLERR